jgi:hypothetical protein
MWRAILPWSLLGALCLGCDLGDQPLSEVDPEAAPAEPTWSEHVQPLMEIYCTACHAPDAQTGESEGYGFETCAKTKRYWGPLYQSTFVVRDMPPGGAPRPLSWELLTLERWHAQGGRCD